MHIHCNKLDLAFAEAGSDLTISSFTKGIFISDHKHVAATLNIRMPKLERKLVTMRKMKIITFDIFQQELGSKNLNCDGLLDNMA